MASNNWSARRISHHHWQRLHRGESGYHPLLRLGKEEEGPAAEEGLPVCYFGREPHDQGLEVRTKPSSGTPGKELPLPGPALWHTRPFQAYRALQPGIQYIVSLRVGREAESRST